MLAITGSKSKIRHEPLPQDDPKQRRPDITKARTLLGWEPKIDLETGLRLSLEYFQKAVHEELAPEIDSHAEAGMHHLHSSLHTQFPSEGANDDLDGSTPGNSSVVSK